MKLEQSENERKRLSKAQEDDTRRLTEAKSQLDTKTQEFNAKLAEIGE